MRLPNELAARALAVAALSTALGGCTLFGGNKAGVGSAGLPDRELVANGPQADYPVVIGDPFTVDGQEFVPADTASYDAVGFAAADPDGGDGITAAHKTLPLPSYVELTQLDTGRTILARVERRGPMTASRVVGLSPGAMAALGASDGSPVRVRRINPPETDRAELRAGRRASERMDTPPSLLGVLKRKLPAHADAAAGLARAEAPPPAGPATPRPVEARTATGPAVPAAATASEERRANTAYPLGRAAQSPASAPATATAPAPVAGPASTAVQAGPPTAPAAERAAVGTGTFVVQAAAFSSKASADRAASRIGGFVTRAGTVYRVRTGPFATRGQAEAALAKVREAGYSDARVFTAG